MIGRFGISRGRSLLLAGFASASLLAGCVLDASKAKLKSPDLPDIELDDFDTLKAQALALLGKLFPDLSESERIEISTSLSFDELLSLKDELEAARDAARAFADMLFTTAKE